MSSVLLAGMAAREAAAIEIMIGMHWRHWKVVTLVRDDAFSVPEQSPEALACMYCVLDLAGMGMRVHAHEHEQRLHAFLAGRSSVLLVRGDGGGWSNRDLGARAGQRLVCLSSPYTMHTMLDALRAALAGESGASARSTTAAAPAALSQRTLPEPAWRRAMALAEQLKVEAASRTAAQAAAEVQVRAERLSALTTASKVMPPPDTSSPLGRDTPTVKPAPTVSLAAASDAGTAVEEEPCSAAEAVPAVSDIPQVEPAVPRASVAPPQGIDVQRTGEVLATAPSNGTERPTPPAAIRPIESTAPRIPTPEAETAATPAAAPRADAPIRGIEAFKALVRMFPSLRALPHVGLLVRLVRGEETKLVHVGELTSFVTHTGQGWLVADRPISDLVELLRVPRPLESFVIEPLPADLTEAKISQRLMERNELVRAGLDELSWRLLSTVLREHELKPDGELYFQLLRFPNFTVLGQVGPLDVQLAAISSRMKQSVTQLASAFPAREQHVYRFVALCVLSGLAAVSQTAAGFSDTAANSSTQGDALLNPSAADRAGIRRGFLQSLLDKLF